MQYLIPIISFSGLLFAILLKKINSEEKEQVKPFLFYLEKLTLVAIITTLLIQNFSHDKIFYLMIITGILLGFLFNHIYIYLGLALLTLNPIIAIFTFIHGLSRQKFNIIKNGILFALPFTLLFLTFDTTHTSAIVIGALTTFLKIK
jgi:hypothetical protein